MPSPKLLDKTETSRLDRYELIGEIASGGMATVYLARLAGVGGFQRFVAIKRLHPHLSNETEFVQMFLDEARLAASIHHPHVVPILEVGTSSAGYYVVMEYVEGDTLAGLLARAASQGQKIPAPVAMRIALDTLSGLHAAHELRDEENNLVNLVHRDVSPQNILVGVDGSARITDFGVAKASSRLTSTRSGTLKGKLAYMPPEQAKAGPIDQRTDVFAMGVVLWESLAGRRLFKGESELETLNRLMFEPIPSLRTFEPSTPEAIEQVILQSLSRNLDQRYSSAAEFADALERTAQGVFPIATVREMAAYVQQILGNEIQRQRAAVRAWLAAEPSQTAKSSEFDSIAKMPASQAAASLPSTVRPPSHRSLSAVVPAIPSSSAPQLAVAPGPLSADAADALLSEPSSTRPGGPRSVTAAAVSLPESVSSPSQEPLAPPPRTSKMALVLPLLLGVIAVGAFVGWSASKSGSPSAAAPASPATSASAATHTTAAPPVTQTALAAAENTAPAAPSASSSAATSIEQLPADRPAAVSARQPGGKKNDKADPKAPPPATAAAPPPTTAAPPPPPAPTSTGDSGYKNPYR